MIKWQGRDTRENGETMLYYEGYSNHKLIYTIVMHHLENIELSKNEPPKIKVKYDFYRGYTDVENKFYTGETILVLDAPEKDAPEYHFKILVKDLLVMERKRKIQNLYD